ncbi:DNA polymerase IV [Myxococcota bacterium]|nr:DNA polymerase IV [Myxococcota bacterium]
MARRVILHADMDAFYTSIEQRDRPELRGRPVIVGGGSARGVVSAASYEARQHGVHSAMPSAEARKLCPEGVFLHGDMKRYAAESRRIFEVFRRFAPRVQGLSLDEAFLDISGTERLLGTPVSLGEALRSAVREETGLTVSAGIAPVKLVAKIACAEAKPDGLLEVTEDGVNAFLSPLPVGRLWGIGRVAEARLHEAGFTCVGELARTEPSQVEALLGSWGLSVARLARGEDFSEVEPYREPVSYSEENTFETDVSDPKLLERTIVAHAESVARRLRNGRLRARVVVLKIKLSRRRGPGPRGYPLLTRRMTLEAPTDDGLEITRAGFELLRRTSLPEPVRLLGVGVTGLRPAGLQSAQQLALIGEREGVERRANLNRALDEVRDRFGDRAVRRGSTDPQRAGLSHQAKRGTRDDVS